MIKEILFTLSLIAFPLTAIAADTPTKMSDTIIDTAVKEFGPSFCNKTISGLQKTAEKIHLCYQKTSKDSPDLEVCFLGDEVLSSLIQPMRTISGAIGGKKLSIPFFSDVEIFDRQDVINQFPKYKNYTDQEKKAYQENSVNAFFDKANASCQ